VKNADEPIVIVDTREQQPFAFHGITGARGRELEIETCRAGLKTGDYSIQGLEDEVAIERKSKVDLYGTVGRGRARFERELERLAAMAAPALVLECDLGSLLRPPERSRVSPSSVLNSLIAWSVRHRIPVWPCPGRRFAEIVTYRLLQHFWADMERQRKEGCVDAG
jgi:DNA excision repair protein ERCC-4